MAKKKSKGNGEGTIYKSSKTGLYVGQYVYNGNRKSVYQKKNEKIGDFKKRFNDILSSINQGSYIEKSNDTFIDILKRHVEQKHDDGITSDSGYVRDLKTVKQIENTCSNFIDMPIQKIKAEHIEASKKNIRKYAQNSINKIWRLIGKTFKIAISRRKIIYNPLDDESLVKPISEKETKTVTALTANEQKKLQQILDTNERNHKYRNIIKLQLEIGARISEVLARSIPNVNFKDNTLVIDNTLTKDKNGKTIIGKHTKTYNKKTNIDHGKRKIPMNKNVREIMLEEISKKVTNMYQLVFWDYEDNTFISYHELNSWLKRINKKYKITNKDLSTHVLRHSAITRMREAGMDMKVIQYIVGHVEGSPITDDVYTSISDEFVEKELRKI